MSGSEDTVKAIWNDQRLWSKFADKKKAKIEGIRNLVLGLTIAGAALQTLATQTPHIGWVIAMIGGICIGLVPWLSGKHLGRENIDEWTRGRSASQAIKGEVYTYRAGAAPYDGDDAVDHLNTAYDAIKKDLKDLLNAVALIDGDSKEPPGPLGRDEYIAQRVDDQAEDYYKDRAKTMAQKATKLRKVEYGLAIVAAIIGLALGSVGGFDAMIADGAAAGEGTGAGAGAEVPEEAWGYFSAIGVWVAVLTTAAAAITAHISASRLDEQVSLYMAAREHLLSLKRRLPNEAVPGTPAWSEFVRACEETIANQNRDWMAVLREDPTG